MKKWMKEWGVPLMIAIIGASLFRTYGFAQIQVFDVSMQHTLYEGHRLIEDRISYRFSEPERGDIVIVNGPEYDKRLIKRVIALPGEVVDIAEGEVWVNGVRLDESYAQGITAARGQSMPYTVPDGHVFVMGDNRERSLDGA